MSHPISLELRKRLVGAGLEERAIKIDVSKSCSELKIRGIVAGERFSCNLGDGYARLGFPSDVKINGHDPKLVGVLTDILGYGDHFIRYKESGNTVYEWEQGRINRHFKRKVLNVLPNISVYDPIGGYNESA
jgi:hypothetical protein